MIFQKFVEIVKDALPWHLIVFPLLMLYFFLTGSSANELLLTAGGYALGMFGMALFIAWYTYRGLDKESE